MTRQENNLKLLELIAVVVNNNPDLRFNQILVNLKFSEGTEESLDYYEESDVTLRRVTEG